MSPDPQVMADELLSPRVVVERAVLVCYLTYYVLVPRMLRCACIISCRKFYFPKTLWINICIALEMAQGKPSINVFVVVKLKNNILINPHIMKMAASTLQIFLLMDF